MLGFLLVEVEPPFLVVRVVVRAARGLGPGEAVLLLLVKLVARGPTSWAGCEVLVMAQCNRPGPWERKAINWCKRIQ